MIAACFASTVDYVLEHVAPDTYQANRYPQIMRYASCYTDVQRHEATVTRSGVPRAALKLIVGKTFGFITYRQQWPSQLVGSCGPLPISRSATAWGGIYKILLPYLER